MIKNYHSAEKVKLIPVENIKVDTNFLKQLNRLMNLPEISYLFDSYKVGNKINEIGTKKYINYAIKSWGIGSNFIYFILDENDIVVGSIDLQKENDESASLGFWISPEKLGFMTNILNYFLKLKVVRNYKTINSYTKPTNLKAINLLRRLNFIEQNKIEGKNLLKFSLNFA
jgi:RimJ/RimL family protein N-acetyltransferase